MKKDKSEFKEFSLLIDSNSLDEDFIKSVGRLTLNFAHLEFCVMLFAWSQIGAPQPLNQIVISELSFKQLLNISSWIYKVVEKDWRKLSIFEEMLKDAFALEQKRNTLTHSFYGHDKKAKIVVRRKNSSKGKKGFVEHEEIIDAKAVNKIADEMDELSMKLKKMIFEISN